MATTQTASSAAPPPKAPNNCRLCQKTGSMDVSEATFDVADESLPIGQAYRTFAASAIGCPSVADGIRTLRLCFACTNELNNAYAFQLRVNGAEERMGTTRAPAVAAAAQRQLDEQRSQLDVELQQRQQSLERLRCDLDDRQTVFDDRRLAIERRTAELERLERALADRERTFDEQKAAVEQQLEQQQLALEQQQRQLLQDALSVECAGCAKRSPAGDGEQQPTGAGPDADLSNGERRSDEPMDSDASLECEFIDEDEELLFYDDEADQPQAATEAPEPAIAKPAPKRADVSLPSPPGKRPRPDSAAPKPQRPANGRRRRHLYIPQYVIVALDGEDASDRRNLTVEVCARRVRRLAALQNTTVVDAPVNRDAFLPAGPNDVYVCQQCPKAFTTALLLMQHMRRNHICQWCLSTYAHTADMHAHVREAHHGRAVCALCERSFNGNSNLRSHCRTWHDLALPSFWSVLAEQDLDEQVSRLDSSDEQPDGPDAEDGDPLAGMIEYDDD